MYSLRLIQNKNQPSRLLKIFNISIVAYIYLAISLFNSKSFADSIANDKLSLSSQEILKINTERNNLIEKLGNDYNASFLPDTHFISLKSVKYDIDFNVDKNHYIENISLQPHPFYVDIYGGNFFITDKLGRIFIISENLLNGLENKKIDVKNFIVTTNLRKNINVLDSYIFDNDLFISYSYGSESCKKIGISKASLSLKKLSFTQIFSPKECSKVVMGGRMASVRNNSSVGLLITTSSEDNNSPDNRAQDKNSIFGKTIFLDTKTNDFSIYSLGHRNAQGIYVDGDLIIQTEHGPRGGDEINLIVQGGNYGWPVASYGEKYGAKELHTTYEKSHAETRFREPVYVFVPSIAIGEIIKVPNQFSEFWNESFLIASLNKKTLYRAKFSNDYSRILYIEPIYIGSRIRDMKFSGNGERLYLALEMPNQIMVLSNY